jgi:hypothetical protein
MMMAHRCSGLSRRQLAKRPNVVYLSTVSGVTAPPYRGWTSSPVRKPEDSAVPQRARPPPTSAAAGHAELALALLDKRAAGSAGARRPADHLALALLHGRPPRGRRHGGGRWRCSTSALLPIKVPPLPADTSEVRLASAPTGRRLRECGRRSRRRRDDRGMVWR